MDAAVANMHRNVPVRRASSPGRGVAPWLALVGVLLAGVTSSGCRYEPRPLFSPLDPPIVWPPAPMPPRVRYVGQLTSSTDVERPRRGLQRLGELLVGGRPVEKLYNPRAVMITPDGDRAWVADPGTRCVHLFDLAGRQYMKVTHAGEVPLLSPVDVCPGPAGSMYVCDSENVAIFQLSDRTGSLQAVLRLPPELVRPVAVRFDAASEQLFVVDAPAHDVKVLGTDGSLRRVIGRRGDAPGEFNYPSAIVNDGDRIWVVDSGNHRVQCLRRTGDPVAAFGQEGDAPGDLAWPKGIAVDGSGHVYVVDARFENVQVFDRAGRLLLYFGHEGAGPGEFWLPSGITIDSHNRIWICDSYNQRLQVFEYMELQDGRSETEVTLTP
jgi:DNA-binding beta-propeller fold protein YncE